MGDLGRLRDDHHAQQPTVGSATTQAMQREVEGARASRDDAFEEDAQALM